MYIFRHKNAVVHHLTISTIQREEFIFQSASAESFVTLVNHILDNLKQISTYVIAIQDWTDDGKQRQIKAVFLFSIKVWFNIFYD